MPNPDRPRGTPEARIARMRVALLRAREFLRKTLSFELTEKEVDEHPEMRAIDRALTETE